MVVTVPDVGLWGWLACCVYDMMGAHRHTHTHLTHTVHRVYSVCEVPPSTVVVYILAWVLVSMCSSPMCSPAHYCGVGLWVRLGYTVVKTLHTHSTAPFLARHGKRYRTSVSGAVGVMAETLSCILYFCRAVWVHP